MVHLNGERLPLLSLPVNTELTRLASLLLSLDFSFPQIFPRPTQQATVHDQASMPHGGWKASGYGRFQGLEGIR